MEWMYFWSKFAVQNFTCPVKYAAGVLQGKEYLYKDYSSGNFQWKSLREVRMKPHLERGGICDVFPVEIVVV